MTMDMYLAKLSELEHFNNMAASLEKYDPDIVEDRWKKNFLKSLREINKLQVAEVLMKSGNAGTPFDNIVSKVRLQRSEGARNQACQSLKNLDEKMCGSGSVDEKVCRGISISMEKLSCGL